VELLPEEYTLRLEPGIGERCFRHYNGAIRHLMYGEGIARLAKQDFFNCRSLVFTDGSTGGTPAANR
jgi:hypothetical protein